MVERMDKKKPKIVGGGFRKWGRKEGSKNIKEQVERETGMDWWG